MQLSTPISKLPGVGPNFAQKLKKLKIEKVQDLIFHFPHRYQDYSILSPISTLQEDETVTIQGQIVSIKNIYTRTGKKIQTAVISDGEDKIDVTWFNQPYLIKTLPEGTLVSLSGKIKLYGRKKILVSPQYEKLPAGSYQLKAQTIHTGRLVPVYPETSSISSKWLRNKMALTLPLVLKQVDEILPENILKKYNLLEVTNALQKIHFPKSQKEAQEARTRLAFDELLQIQIESLIRRKNWLEKKVSHSLRIEKSWVRQFTANLPFKLTQSQRGSGREILLDLAKQTPMNRLLQGDVGSGKTVIAALACFIASKNGFQSAIMAPTQILAMQHYKTLTEILKPLGVKISIVTSETQNTKHKTRNTKPGIFVGTHSLIQKGVNFEKLALIVIDEQHRFGVLQRATLAKKGGEKTPHILTMTATPIPRTVALTVYGDLKLSYLTELPRGRKIIKTWIVPKGKREKAYEWIRERVKNTKEQAFIVCPIIEESFSETLKSVKAAKVEFERLSREVFPDLRLSLIHGKTKREDKERIMKKMKEGELDILVATPIVEVGIDIPNATIMMIEAAERFGLAQLHQLRGRVGRADMQSYCLLFTQNWGANTAKRLKAMEKNLSGAQLAELDLEMRGPGTLYGTAQHGFPELKVASFSDTNLIKLAREGAEELVSNAHKYPKIKKLLSRKQELSTY